MNDKQNAIGVETQQQSSLSNSLKQLQEQEAIVHLYPFNNSDNYNTVIPDNDKDKFHCIKILHFIRHAQGTHNVKREYHDPQNMDARLTEKGQQQCRNLANQIRNGAIQQPASLLMKQEDNNDNNDDESQHILIVTSPLTRCMQTTLRSLEPIIFDRVTSKKNLSIIVHEEIRETVDHMCDHRRTMTEIQNDIETEFPQLVQNNIRIDYTTNVRANHDSIWEEYEQRLGTGKFRSHRESGEIHVVAERGRTFFRWLRRRPEQHVFICSHSDYLTCIFNYGICEIPNLPSQYLVDTPPQEQIPIFNYCTPANDDPKTEKLYAKLRTEFANCELRSIVAAFVK